MGHSMLNDFLNKLSAQPTTIQFEDVIAVIDESYDFTATKFYNGYLVNEATENTGSCKLFALGRLNKFTKQQMLECFGTYYRDDVLNNPDGDDHANIRYFMRTGWSGIQFETLPLKLK